MPAAATTRQTATLNAACACSAARGRTRRSPGRHSISRCGRWLGAVCVSGWVVIGGGVCVCVLCGPKPQSAMATAPGRGALLAGVHSAGRGQGGAARLRCACYARPALCLAVPGLLPPLLRPGQLRHAGPPPGCAVQYEATVAAVTVYSRGPGNATVLLTNSTTQAADPGRHKRARGARWAWPAFARRGAPTLLAG